MNKQQKQIMERLKQIPKHHKEKYEKAMEGRSLRAGVNAFCLECIGYASSFASDIRNCTDLACPLYPYRPYK